MKLSPTLAGLRTYPFVRLTEAKRRLAADGVDFVDFGMGEPREETPAFIREALAAAIEPLSSYPSADGLPELLVAAHRADYPVGNPDPSMFDVGVIFLIDGATRSILTTYYHPEPQPGSAPVTLTSARTPTPSSSTITSEYGVLRPGTGMCTVTSV